MRPTEFTSLIRWRAIERGTEHAKPQVLYFEDEPPVGFLDSGLYVNFEDFRDVLTEARTTNEPLAALYHTLVLHLARKDPRLLKQAYKDLRYNPQNGASWNKAAYTYQYYLLTEALLPYATEPPTSQTKIEGVGKKGRFIIDLVVREDNDLLMFGPPLDNV